MNDRVDIKDYILYIEQNFPVNDWEMYNIKIWPFIRIKLFFFLINEIELKVKKTQYIKPSINATKKTYFQRIIFFFRKGLKARLINKLGKFYSYLWIAKLPNKEFLFLGANSHRVNYENTRYNRYFDTYIEENNLQNHSLIFEYDNVEVNNYRNDNLIYKYNLALKNYRKIRDNNEDIAFIGEQSYTIFIEFLHKGKITKDFAIRYNTRNTRKFLTNIYDSCLFFQIVLKKIKPSKIFILCYYSDEMMALIHAANSLNINTIDVQHGSQTDIHLAYGNWSKIPEIGYTTMPKEFWCWDNDSANVLNKWIKNTNNIRIKITGNFWVDYWKNKNTNYNHKDYILYSLQPLPITIEELFPNNIINIIKHKPYKWFIRLHPRQYDFKPQIIEFLKNNKILDLVNIEDASNDPLPLLLKNCLIHITHSSTTVVEASFFNKFTIIINQIGRDYYPELIENVKAKYIDSNDNKFQIQFQNIIDSL